MSQFFQRLRSIMPNPPRVQPVEQEESASCIYAKACIERRETTAPFPIGQAVRAKAHNAAERADAPSAPRPMPLTQPEVLHAPGY